MSCGTGWASTWGLGLGAGLNLHPARGQAERLSHGPRLQGPEAELATELGSISNPFGRFKKLSIKIPVKMAMPGVRLRWLNSPLGQAPSQRPAEVVSPEPRPARFSTPLRTSCPWPLRQTA